MDHARSRPDRWRPTPVGCPLSSRASMPMRIATVDVRLGACENWRTMAPREHRVFVRAPHSTRRLRPRELLRALEPQPCAGRAQFGVADHAPECRGNAFYI